MSALGRTWALLLVSYFTALQIVAIIWSSGLSFGAQTLFNVAVVPVLQAAALYGIARHAAFFAAWAVCAVVQVVVTPLVGLLVFRNVPFTIDVVVASVFVPVVQSASLTLTAPAIRSFLSGVRETLEAPLARPVLWIDLIAIPVGFIWSTHPAVGIAVAGGLQRRWIATKLMASATIFFVSAARVAASDSESAGRATRLAAAVVIALVAANEFRPWLLDAANAIPSPFVSQPNVLVLFAIYAIGLIAVVWLIRACARSLPNASGSRAVFDGAAVTLFLAGLAQLVNGFVSLLPVRPWAGLAVAFGTAAATLLAVGAIASVRRT